MRFKTMTNRELITVAIASMKRDAMGRSDEGVFLELSRSLMTMGFREVEVRRAIGHVDGKHDEAFTVLLRDSLQFLGR